MTYQRLGNLSSGSLPLPMDFIDLTEESPVHRSLQISNSSKARLQLRLGRKLKKDEIVTPATSEIPSASGTRGRARNAIRSGTRNAAKSGTRNATNSGTRNAANSGARNAPRSGTKRVATSNAGVRSRITASNKLRRGSNDQCRNEAKPNETINLDETILPGHSGLWCTNDSTSLICAICLEQLLPERKPTATRCGHIFCEECLNQAMDKLKKCPQCRTSITKKSSIRLHF